MHDHWVLRPSLWGRIFGGTGGVFLVLVAVFNAFEIARHQPYEWKMVGMTAIVLGLGIYCSFHRPTLAIHVTPSRIWKRQFWLTIWSASKQDAAVDWDAGVVKHRSTGKIIGKLNYVQCKRETLDRIVEAFGGSRASASSAGS